MRRFPTLNIGSIEWAWEKLQAPQIDTEFFSPKPEKVTNIDSFAFTLSLPPASTALTHVTVETAKLEALVK